MRQFVIFSALLIAIGSCSGNKKQVESADAPFELDNLLAVADQQVENTITVVGYVTHTCIHSGKRCFIVGDSQETSFRIEAQGEIETFSSELVGSKLAVTGVLKEQHLSGEFIDELESDVKQREGEEGMAEACATELSNISDMRKWMKDHGKDYYVIYYMDGLKYDVMD